MCERAPLNHDWQRQESNRTWVINRSITAASPATSTGHKGSRPVRIRNHVYTHLLLDVYGELIDSIYLYDKHVGRSRIGPLHLPTTRHGRRSGLSGETLAVT
jgi:GH15 family glucan-1,4-alpha-glucosidase